MPNMMSRLRRLLTRLHALLRLPPVRCVASATLPTEFGAFNIHAFKNILSGETHVALVRGEIGNGENVLTRVHSACLTGDLFHSARCDCGRQLHTALQQIVSEVKAKEVRFQLENLHGQITRCTQDGILPANEAKHWVNEIRHMLVQLHIELFGNLGHQALQQNQPGQARLAFERGVQYLRKQTDNARYQAPLQKFEAQLARANAMVVDMGKPAADDASELTAGLKSLESEEDWKKKNIYD